MMINIEIQYVEYYGRLETDTRRVLQYRVQREFVRHLPSGEMLASHEWTDWRDVPVVLAQVITPEDVK